MSTMRHHVNGHGLLHQGESLLRTVTSGLAERCSRFFDRSRAEEEAAAARYWAAIGHDIPAEARSARLSELSREAPVVKIHRRHPHPTR